ncbi:MAG TPA: EamA family transporter [Pseudonocardia sp.]|uniref:EamA family transporter n=1 Tax=Pseudonocardia sp. TaxID=60912 RepID=UPI002F3EAE61
MCNPSPSPLVEGPRTSPARGGRSGAVALILGGQFCTQFGAAAATSLFPLVGVAGAVTLRLSVAALVLLAVARPSPRGRTAEDWVVVAAFGVVLAAMNLLFYNALDRMPLGAAVTIEFLGPLTLSVLTGRRALSWLWAALALGGVTLLGRDGFAGSTFTGTLFALGAATMWACYILLSRGTGARFHGLAGLALAMSAGAAASLPFGILDAGAALLRPGSLVLGGLVAALSSLLPYSFELISLRTVHPATFAVLLSLSPAVAATAGVMVLGQPLTLAALGAIALVVTASTGAIWASRPRE